MRNKKIKPGVVLDLSENDIAFIDALFQESKDAEFAADRYMRKAHLVSNQAWSRFYSRYKQFEGFDVTLRNHQAIVVSKKYVPKDPKDPRHGRAKKALA